MHALRTLARRLTRRMTPTELAAQELARAEISHLESLGQMEYAQAVVAYHEARIARLRVYLAERNGANAPAGATAPGSSLNPATNVGMGGTRPSALYNLARNEA